MLLVWLMWCRYLRQLSVRSSYDSQTRSVAILRWHRPPWGVSTTPRRCWYLLQTTGCHRVPHGRVSTTASIGRMSVVATMLESMVPLVGFTETWNHQLLAHTAHTLSLADVTWLLNPPASQTQRSFSLWLILWQKSLWECSCYKYVKDLRRHFPAKLAFLVHACHELLCEMLFTLFFCCDFVTTEIGNNCVESYAGW